MLEKKGCLLVCPYFCEMMVKHLPANPLTQIWPNLGTDGVCLRNSGRCCAWRVCAHIRVCALQVVWGASILTHVIMSSGAVWR